MKRIIVFLGILTLSFNLSYGQKVDKKQIEVGQKFLNLVLKGQAEKSWNLFDKANVPSVTQEDFNTAVNQVKSDLAIFDAFELVMTGIKIVDNKQLNLYTYKAVSKSKKVVDEISVDLLFFQSSKLVAGFQPKKLLKENSASTTKAKETPIESNFTATIDSTSYIINGINIVHFENNQGLLAIQIQYKLPTNLPDMQQWGHVEAIKFAKYLVLKGYMEKAKVKAKELNRILLEDIGVSFLDPSNGAGFNVMLKPNEYK